jgi:hypothetical protein
VGCSLRPYKFERAHLWVGCACLCKASDGLKELTLPTTKTDVLGGRLVISLPNGATSVTAPRNIMAAAQPQAVETLVVIDAGEQRMDLTVSELFAHEGSDFAGEARNEIGP